MRPLGIYTILLFALVLTSFTAPLALASDEVAPIIFEGTDISSAVSYFKKLVVPLQTPVTIYHWSRGAEDSFWSQNHESSSPNFLALARDWSQSFWWSYGTAKGTENMYGTGLYGAVDPVVTLSYGGGLASQVLLQLDLPRGFKLLDLGNSALANQLQQPTRVGELEAHFGCPSSRGADEYFQSGGAALTPQCARFVRKIFQDILSIDGFAYGYSKTNFKACAAGMSVGDRAFVIIKPDWMNADLVHFYTSKTTGDLDGRIRLQTIFMMTIEEQMLSSQSISLSKISDYLIEHPDSNLRGSKTNCTESTCVITVHFCDSKNSCDDVALDPLMRPYGPLITSAEAARTSVGSLLWPDLENKPKSDSASEWIKKTEFGCSGTLPYNTPDAVTK